jgi:DNA-binding MarR family transcriptional regulator
MTDPIELLVALRRYGLENDRFDASVARAHDVSLAEMKAIDHIQAEGELTPRQLGERLSLSSGAVTAVIDRLERGGWVERRPHPSDRRSVVVRMSEQSMEEGARIYLPYSEALAQAAAHLPAASRKAMADFLNHAADIAAARAREWRDSGPAPTARPGPGSPPTPAA